MILVEVYFIICDDSSLVEQEHLSVVSALVLGYYIRNNVVSQFANGVQIPLVVVIKLFVCVRAYHCSLAFLFLCAERRMIIVDSWNFDKVVFY